MEPGRQATFMNIDLTICQLWFRLARVFNVFAPEAVMVLVWEQDGVIHAAPSTS
jgi:hypothetical protein